MADVLLVRPNSGYYSFLAAPMLPLGLLSIASNLVKEGFEVKIIDWTSVKKNWKKVLKSELQKNPLCVGITSMTGPQISYALEISRFVKEHSGVPVVWGGVHASLLPGQTLGNSYVDIVVKGEGEVTFYELVEALKKGKSLKGIKGVWYKKNGKIYSNPDRPFTDLNKLPELPYHLVDIKQYIQNNSFGRALDVETSRGCPYNCSFCYNTVVSRARWRAMNSERLFEKVKYLVSKFNLQYILIIDDYFLLDKNRVESFAQNIIENNLDFKWGILGGHFKDFNKLDKYFLKLLEKSNCKLVGCGIESGSPRILKLIRKGITVDQIIRANEKVKDFDITFISGFMAGFPTETKEDLQKSIALLFKLKKINPNLIFAAISNYIPFPGTELFRLSQKYGFKPPSSLEGWAKVDWGLNHKNLELPWLSKKDKQMLNSLYFCSAFLDTKEEPSFFCSSRFILLLSWLYKPVARFRVKNLYFKYMLEMRIINFLRKFSK